jgi:hypothetical protein
MTSDKVISSILSIINPVLNKRYNESISFPLEFTFCQVLERVKFNLESIKVLLDKGIDMHDHAIGLISRNLLTDFITTGYVIKLSNSEEEIDMKLYALYNSDLKKVDSLLKTLKKADFVSNDELNVINEKYSNDNKVIRDYCIEYEIKSFPSINTIIESFIKSDLKDIWSDQIKRSYDIWIFYSKYEHLGWSSFDLTRNTSAEKANERLTSVLMKTLILLGSCLEILKEKKGLTDSMELLKQIKRANVYPFECRT